MTENPVHLKYPLWFCKRLLHRRRRRVPRRGAGFSGAVVGEGKSGSTVGSTRTAELASRRVSGPWNEDLVLEAPQVDVAPTDTESAADEVTIFARDRRRRITGEYALNRERIVSVDPKRKCLVLVAIPRGIDPIKLTQVRVRASITANRRIVDFPVSNMLTQYRIKCVVAKLRDRQRVNGRKMRGHGAAADKHREPQKHQR